MPVCKVCKGEKPNREMAMWGGVVTETCLDCKAAKKAARKANPQAIPPALENTGSPVIEVEPTLGFSASVDGESLVISQQNAKRENDPDNITLSRAEARMLFGLFGEWAGPGVA